MKLSIQKITLLLTLLICSEASILQCNSGELTKRSTLILESASNGGYYRARISEKHRIGYKELKIKSIEYYADNILIKKLTPNDAIQLQYTKPYRITLENPDKRTKLQPVKHKWIITTEEGILTEEKTLYVFEKDLYEGFDTFVEAYDSEPMDTLDKQRARFRFREVANKQPPVVSVHQGEFSSIMGGFEFWEVYGVDNSRITKVEYYIDGDLVYTYTGELPHRFEVINPKKKSIGAFLDLTFKVYDDEGNPTEVPAFGRVKKDTRTEFHDDKWLYLEKKWMYIKKK